MTIIQGIQQRPLHHDYKQTKTLPVIMIVDTQFSNQCDRCKMLKVVHGNQSPYLVRYTAVHTITIYDLVPKGVHKNMTKGVENKVDDKMKLAMFLECAQC